MCCCLLPKRKRTFKLGLKRALRRKLELKVPKSDLQLEENPFLLLGYGMNSYLKIMVQLTVMCFMICFITVPLMMTYSNGAGLPGYGLYSMGSLGGAETMCAQTPIHFDNASFNIQCPANTKIDMAVTGENTDNGLVYDAGMVSGTAAITNVCTNAAMSDADSCSQYIKRDELTAYLQENCHDQDSCVIAKPKDFLNVD
jgi:hypothetical protein